MGKILPGSAAEEFKQKGDLEKYFQYLYVFQDLYFDVFMLILFQMDFWNRTME